LGLKINGFRLAPGSAGLAGMTAIYATNLRHTILGALAVPQALAFNSRAPFEQQLYHVSMSVESGSRDRCATIVGVGFNRRAFLQQLHHFKVPFLGGNRERRGTVYVFDIDRGRIVHDDSANLCHICQLLLLGNPTLSSAR
jgi:hypothetical protein